MKQLKENPKLSISLIITLILEVWTLFSNNSELFNIQGETLAKISVIVSIISLVWKQVKPTESVFKMAFRHVGTRSSKPTTTKPKDN